MKIGFLVPASFAIGGPGNGVLAQARMQAAALERRGHQVLHLDPWNTSVAPTLDVLHLFQGGPHFHTLQRRPALASVPIVAFSPIIDSNQSFLAYRLAALAGEISPRLLTIPGLIRGQAKNCDVIVCRSRHEQQRAIQSLGMPGSKVRVVLNGAAPASTTTEDPQHLKRRLDLPDQFILHISAFTQERKNVLRLVEAAHRLGYPLVIAGHGVPGSILSELERRAERTSTLRVLPFVDEKTKNGLYASCKVFCLPSIHEGTGLVALEAARAGAKLVITKHGGPSDYFLDYAEYVDPFDTKDIADGIQRAWERAPTTRLAQHITAHLTWDRSAADLEAVYQEFMTKG